jgi:hypothetical protein
LVKLLIDQHLRELDKSRPFYKAIIEAPPAFGSTMV